MKILILGATGMVGQGLLRECLLDSEVDRVLTLVRSPTGQQNAKLREIVHQDFFDFSSIEQDLSGYDACMFCLGVSSAGMSEQQYRRLTYSYFIGRRLHLSGFAFCASSNLVQAGHLLSLPAVPSNPERQAAKVAST